jgi:hypothetical protein
MQFENQTEGAEQAPANSLDVISSIALNTASDPIPTASVIQQLQLQDLQAPHLDEDMLLTFIYSYAYNTDHLLWTNLVTGKQSGQQVTLYFSSYSGGVLSL